MYNIGDLVVSRSGYIGVITYATCYQHDNVYVVAWNIKNENNESFVVEQIRKQNTIRKLS